MSSELSDRRRLRMRPRPQPVTQVVSTAAPARPAPAALTTQIVPRSGVLRLYRLIQWIVCLLCFVVTTLGNIGMFGADIRLVLDRAVWFDRAWQLAVVAGAGMQLVVQIGQWANANNKQGLAYRAWLAASVIPSCITYLPLLVPLAASVAFWGELIIYRWSAGAGAALLTTLVLIGVDVLQEKILLKEV